MTFMPFSIIFSNEIIIWVKVWNTLSGKYNLLKKKKGKRKKEDDNKRKNKRPNFILSINNLINEMRTFHLMSIIRQLKHQKNFKNIYNGNG